MPIIDAVSEYMTVFVGIGLLVFFSTSVICIYQVRLRKFPAGFLALGMGMGATLFCFFAPRYFVLSSLSDLMKDPSIQVTSVDEIPIPPEVALGQLVEQVTQFKGLSGSSPTSEAFRFSVCTNVGVQCLSVQFLRDSRDPDRLWVVLRDGESIEIPLGYSRASVIVKSAGT